METFATLDFYAVFLVLLLVTLMAFTARIVWIWRKVTLPASMDFVICLLPLVGGNLCTLFELRATLYLMRKPEPDIINPAAGLQIASEILIVGLVVSLFLWVALIALKQVLRRRGASLI